MREIITSLRLFVLSMLACSVIYPALVLAFAVIAAPDARKGSLVRDSDGTIVGSRLLAQGFTSPGYFWPRPSACDYNASATGGSNLSPTNSLLTESAREIIGRLGPGEGQSIPADLVSASGSGMDPHISLAGARFQVPRVAIARRLEPERVDRLIQEHISSAGLVVLGRAPTVNVLELNLALDQLSTLIDASP